MATTTYYSPKPFTWSYSRLKNFEACPKKHFEVDIKKSVREPDSEQLRWGDLVHKAMAARCANGTQLPQGMEAFEVWCNRLLRGEGRVVVEQKLAITKEFEPTEFFAKNVWFRGVADLIKITGDVALVLDWKTGKILEDSVQLALSAQCVFSHYPEIKAIRSQFVWLKDDADTREDFYRSDMPGLWRTLWPRIEALKNAHDTSDYPPKPSGLCKKHCPVVSCGHNGQR